MHEDREVLLFCYFGLFAITTLANLVEVPVYLHMMVDTMLIIYIGCHFSVSTHAKGAEGGMEQMSSKDAYMFPVIGSVFLFSLYLVFKFLPPEYVNFVVKAYFFVLGVLVLSANIEKFLSLIVEERKLKKYQVELFSFKFRIPFFSSSPASAAATTTPTTPPPAADGKKDGNKKATTTAAAAAVADDSIKVSRLDIVCLIIASLFGVWYLSSNHWSASNLFGIAFSVQGIEFLSLGSFFNGAVLLVGLFFYDVFWVFGTDVMVTVAKKFDAPIKLLFPRQLGLERPSMLGLGDIVIPGIFIALMLRYDYTLAKNGVVKKRYFTNLMIGYFIGLTVTVFVMYQFNAAQPALLYLVPACLGSSLLTAAYKGQFKRLLNFTEEQLKPATKN